MKKNAPVDKEPGRKAGRKKAAADAGRRRRKSAGDKVDLAALRKKAEAVLRQDTERLEDLSKHDMRQLIQELGTYQIELEMQNEELRRSQQYVEEARNRYIDLYDYAPVGYFSLDANGVILSANLSGAALLGRARGELFGKSLSGYVLPEDQDAFYRCIRDTIEKMTSHSCEVGLMKEEGQTIHVLFETSPVIDNDEMLAEIRLTLTDITERVEAKRSLTRQNELLNVIINTTDVLLAYLDREFNFVWVNEPYAHASGKKAAELVGKNHFDLYPDTENEAIFRQVRNTGEAVFFKDKTFLPPDQPDRGLTYWDWSLAPVKDKGGRVTNMVLSLRETTTFKKMQLDLAESEAKFRTMAETSTDIIFQADSNGRFTYVSPSVAALGHRPEDIIGHHYSEFVVPENIARAQAAFRKILLGNRVNLFDVGLLRADNSVAESEINASPIVWEDVVVGMQGIARDVTERRLHEKKIQRQNETLAGINAIFSAGMQCGADPELAQAALRVAERITGSQFGFVGEVGSDGLLRDMAMSDPGWEECEMADKTGHRQSPGNFRVTGLHGKVLKEGKSFFSNDPPKHPASVGTPSGHPDLAAFLGVPLQHGDQTIGLIALANRNGGYGPEDVRAVEVLAGAFVETLFKCRIERALLQSEAKERSQALRLKQFLDFTPVPVWIAHDPKCHRISGNLVATSLMEVESDVNFSQTPDPGTPVVRFRHFKDGIELTAERLPLQQAVRKGVRIDDIEVDVVKPNGGTVRMLGAAIPLFDHEGKIQGGIAAYVDITERKKIEAQLQRAKLEWERTFDAVPDFIAILDRDHTIVRANRAMAERVGASPDQLVGRKCFACFHGPSAAIQNCPHARTLQDGKEHTVEVMEEETESYLLVTTAPLLDKNGSLAGCVHIARDISEQKRAEQEIKELNSELQKSLARLEEVNESLARSNTDLLHFASIVSHDLREPLRTVASFAQLLERRYKDRLDEKAFTFMNHIVDGTGHMQRLLDDLLSFSRVGGDALNFQDVDMENVVEEVVRKLSRRIRENRARIKATGLPVVQGDQMQLFTLMQNLLSNAIKYKGSEQPKINITGQRRGKHWIVSVQDNGIGFEPKHNEHIFKIFQRLHLRNEYEGTGIGLAICKRIVERHGGRIWAESTPGQGSTFSFCLPLQAEAGRE